MSYGTFSCTLEGFDDSFDTMKAIAEYFRDLASDDRYFGAEPPTPDAEMLARIAEREVSRRVEARTDGSGIVLRTGQALPPVTQPAPVAQPAPAAPPAPVAEPTAKAPDSASAPEAAPTPAPQPAPAAAEAPRQAQPQPHKTEPAEPAPVEVDASEAEAEWSDPAPTPHVVRPRTAQDADSVAAKLQRIRAVVGRQTSFAAECEEEDIAPASQQRPAAGMFDTAPQRTPAPPPRRVEEAPATKAPEPAAPAAQQDDTTAEVPAQASQAHPARARVVRMRKADFDRALARGEAHRMIETEAATPEPASASHEQPDVADAEADAAEPQAESTAIVPQAAEFEDTPQAADPKDAPQAAESKDAPVVADAASNSDADVPETLSQETEARDETAPAAPAAAPARTDAQLSEDAERALLEELAALEREMGFDQDGPASQEIAQRDGVAQDEPSFGDLANEASVEMSDAEAETPKEDHSEVASDLPSDLPKEFVFNTDPEAEASDKLAHERRSTDVGEAAAEDETDAIESDRPAEAPHGAVGAQTLGTDEADMSRILSATAARMADPESGRRRDAISQLKAAVAATEAARRLGEVEARQTAEDVFRDDLRQAVRPRRPSLPTQDTDSSDAAQPRPERPRPAPLKLVASQRVDITEEPAKGGRVPVRPRRVAVAEAEPAIESQPEARTEAPAPKPAEAAPAFTESFSDFATRMRAHDLHDLLEAAAAYTAFVEGAEDFSRPQLMDRVREVCPEPISREDGLRSFGTLLRQGMLKRVRSGRFAVASSSRFNPERRAG
ncbi:hypothetical protein [uncultured Limimaricola sp.]|uniref:hypothetical protein n=1 Tax=uncultured Limimaricola sp. TaxID=2211667 RepID=UPI0030FC5901